MAIPEVVQPATPEQFRDNIGDVRMAEDGTLFCRYRIESKDGDGNLTAIGDGMFTVKPGDPAYRAMLTFLGGMKPGENKPLPRVGPFIDEPVAVPPSDPAGRTQR